MTKYECVIERGQRRHGDRFTTAELDSRFVPYFNTGERIKVDMAGEILTGTVGITTGWKPVFLLMRTKRSLGSCWTLGARDRILAVQ